MIHRHTEKSGPVSGGAIGHGFTLVEAVMSMLIVGLMLVAALNTVGASKIAQSRNAEQNLGPMLAEDLLTEILGQVYEEPDDTPEFGRESEPGGDRNDWDDVDDYNGWSASPPQNKDGTDIPDLAGWGRSVTVVFVNPGLVDTSASDIGHKRIHVTVTHNGRVVSELWGLRTSGWPDYQPQTDLVTPLRVLYVVTNLSPTPQEASRIALIESWGFTVNLIQQGAAQAEFNQEATNNDVAYIGMEVNTNTLSTKLRNFSIGVVNEEMDHGSIMGFSNNYGTTTNTNIMVTDNTHYITSTFTTGFLDLYSSVQNVHYIDTPWGFGMQQLGEIKKLGNNYRPALAVIETGGGMVTSDPAAGRRVQLPWGNAGFDFNALNADGQTLMKRAIEWAASME